MSADSFLLKRTLLRLGMVITPGRSSNEIIVNDAYKINLISFRCTTVGDSYVCRGSDNIINYLRKEFPGKENYRIQYGDVVQYYKREKLSKKELLTNMYLYKILYIATVFGTDTQLIIYMALYDDFKVFAMPIDDFMKEVDKNEHPDIVQKFLFDKFVVSLPEESNRYITSDI